MEHLTKDAIVGQRIARVWQTEWRRSTDLVSCAVYVELGNGYSFELALQDWHESLPIPNLKLDTSKLLPARFPAGKPGCDGEMIVGVMDSEEWLSFGLALASKRILLKESYDAIYLGADIIPFSEITPEANVREYWTHDKIYDALI